MGGSAVERELANATSASTQAPSGVDDAERKLWWHLRRIPIEDTHFRRQATVGPYFVDFARHERRLVVEVDGGQHNESEHVAADALRADYLKANDYRVLRFWNHDVLKNIEGVMESIYAAGHEAAPPPLTPPHRAARGGRGAERARPAARPAHVADHGAHTSKVDHGSDGRRDHGSDGRRERKGRP